MQLLFTETMLKILQWGNDYAAESLNCCFFVIDWLCNLWHELIPFWSAPEKIVGAYQNATHPKETIPFSLSLLTWFLQFI